MKKGLSSKMRVGSSEGIFCRSGWTTGDRGEGDEKI